jgi:GDP-L-fucose synthase
MIDWKNTRVLVTGGWGFLGSYVVERLRQRGADRIVLPKSTEYDLVDGGAVRRLLAEARPEIVIHLAGRVGGIGANRESPGRLFYDNAMMGIQLMHEAYAAGVRKLVATATICAYPKFCPVPFKEEDIWNGYPEETNAPYGIAKKLLSVQSGAYRTQYGFNSVVVYPVNLYGPRDNFDLDSGHVIPALLRKFGEAKDARRSSVELWGDGSPTREFLYVEDCAEAVVLAAERYDSSKPLNIGSGAEISIRDLAHKVRALVGYTGEITWNTSQPNGQPRRGTDTSKAREHLSFAARTSLDEGLKKTLAWIGEKTSPRAPE